MKTPNRTMGEVTRHAPGTMFWSMAGMILLFGADSFATGASPPPGQHLIPTFQDLPLLERHAAQANQAFKQCRKYVDGWLSHADATTGLIPRNLNRDKDKWNGKDSAADNYPFMVMTCALTDRERFHGRMRAMLETEARLTCRVGRLVDVFSFTKQAFHYEQANLDRMIFDSSEYVKDGLMPLTELLGHTPWTERMTGIIDDILEHAPHQTLQGAIPADNVEVNGEMMQVLGRLYWMTGDEKYLSMATRIADYYLLGSAHPTRDRRVLRLDDHSCELLSGLTEVYVTCRFALKEKAAVYREPIHAMLDRILEIGVNADGLMFDTIDPVAGRVVKEALTDNWGYNYNAFYAVYMVDGIERYRQAVVHALESLNQPKYLAYPWEGWGSDGIADAVEGAINLYNRERVEGVDEWIDANIFRMLAIQKPDGVIEGWHGDGNFARTAIMWALWKQQGITLQPWRADVKLGAIESPHGIQVVISAETPWTGRLIFDRPRHRVIMKMPLDYPRINQFPEWFTVKADVRYRVVRGASAPAEMEGADLIEGLPMELQARQSLRIAVAPVVPENPFFAFDNGIGRGELTPREQARTLRELGYAGIGYTGTADLAERLKAFKAEGLEVFNLYVACKPGTIHPDPPQLEETVKLLEGTRTMLWLTIQGKTNDEQAAEAVRHIADVAARHKVKVALYPHHGFYVATATDAFRLARKVDRDNVGVTFNLCHELRAGNLKQLDDIIEEIAPKLFLVSINGAEGEGGWDQLIKPLGEGSFDVGSVLGKLAEVNYSGPIGLQCYNVKGDQRENLRRSLVAWKKLRQATGKK